LVRHKADVFGQMSPNACGHPCVAEGFVRSLAWLGQYTRRKTPHPGWSTYGMKHDAERHEFALIDGAVVHEPRYVTQDEFLMAALLRGFTLFPLPGRARGLAWLLNIGKMKPEVKTRLREEKRANLRG
jgi:hypothetical protein